MRDFLLSVIASALLPLYGQTSAPQRITLEQALVLIEEQYEVNVIYNPREVKSSKQVLFPARHTEAKQAIEWLLGEDYRVVQHGETLTIRYVPQRAAKAQTATPVVTPCRSDTVIPHADTTKIVVLKMDSAASSCPTRPVVLPVLPNAQFLSCSSLPVFPHIQFPTRSSLPEVENRSLHAPHRLFLNLALGYGDIAGIGNVATTLDLTYAWFFHRHWGISLGAGVDCYAKTAEIEQQTRMTTAYIPIGLQTEYMLTNRVGIIGDVSASLQLPISGRYCEDESGNRYAGSSLLFGVRGDVGIEVVPVPQLGLGISLYAQSLVASTGDIAQTIHGKWIYPWQTGLNLSLRVNRWKK